MSEWLWILVEAVLKMTDKGFESWGGVYTCGHGTNGQLGTFPSFCLSFNNL
jgi:hypothetical protein